MTGVLPAALWTASVALGGRSCNNRDHRSRLQRRQPMPYGVNADLPPSVRSHLPEHAQDIFREAFNHAHAAHAHDPRQEEAAFRIAWAAVKRAYEKVGDEWLEKR